MFHFLTMEVALWSSAGGQGWDTLVASLARLRSYPGEREVRAPWGWSSYPPPPPQPSLESDFFQEVAGLLE